MFLSDEEVESLTRRKRPRAQIEVLRQRRIPFELDGDGRPVVMECLLKEHMDGADKDLSYAQYIQPEKPPEKTNLEKWRERCKEEARSGIVDKVKPLDLSPALEQIFAEASVRRSAPAPSETEYHRYRRQATPRSLSYKHRQEMRQMYSKTKGTKRGPGKTLSVDHIIPLRGDGVCGLHVPWNLRIIPLVENQSKNNRVEKWK